MKKEIMNLINSKEGYLKINKYTALSRFITEDNGNVYEDVLKVELSITHAFDYVKLINARDFESVIKEVEIAIVEAFAKASNKYINYLKNGYIGGNL